MTAYYNENDPYCAAWLRRLIDAKLIAPGVVDSRSISDVKPRELASFDQCHFFAGIGGWSRALRLADWPDRRAVWTGSCPCQPFSVAGQNGGFADKRHLWPDWFHLISVCKPPVVFGEQVAGAVKGGWLDVVLADLEAKGYACGASVLPACSVGAPHIRQRLWFVADADQQRQRETRSAGAGQWAGRGGASGELADAGILDLAARAMEGRRALVAPEQSGEEHRGPSDLADAAITRWCQQPQRDAGTDGRPAAEPGRLRDAGPWSDLVWLSCSDGKARPTQPGLQPLAHGVPGRVGRLRAYGNAIVPQVAAEFIRAFDKCRVDEALS